MKHTYLLFIFLIFLLSACIKKTPHITTYKLRHSDYIEIIDADGTIQAVNNITLITPQLPVSSVSVGHLAAEGTIVKKGDIVCILDAPELIFNYEKFRSDLETMEADLKKAEADHVLKISVLNSQVETNSAQLAITMLDSIQIKFATPVKQKLLALEMEKATIEKKKLQKKLAAQQIIDNSEINSINSRIVMQKSQMQVFEDQIKSLTMTAPCDGVVIHSESPIINIMGNGVGTLGGKIEEKSTVWSNMPLLQFPDMKEMQLSVDVPESDYKRILEGQKTFITVEAATNLHTTGKIKRKSLAGKSISENSKVKAYEIIISIDSCHDKIKPGLSAAVQIIVDEVKDTIIVPASAIFTHDSTKIVYVADNGKFIQNTVETGLANSSSVIISKGLKGNETIALIEPPHFMIRKTVKTINSDTIKSSVEVSNNLTNDTSGKHIKTDNK